MAAAAAASKCSFIWLDSEQSPPAATPLVHSSSSTVSARRWCLVQYSSSTVSAWVVRTTHAEEKNRKWKGSWCDGGEKIYQHCIRLGEKKGFLDVTGPGDTISHPHLLLPQANKQSSKAKACRHPSLSLSSRQPAMNSWSCCTPYLAIAT